ncbi:MAG: hypothetical protein RR280_08535 [Bacteroidaceae bacterium]
MKKVMQTVTGLGGNCEGAVLATVLGLDLEDIPSFWSESGKENPTFPKEGAAYQERLNAFLKQHGYQSLSLGANEPHEDWVMGISMNMKGVPLIVGGMSPRGFMHAVIYKDGFLWHDPHPEGGGVIPYHIAFLVPTFGAI